MRVQGLGVGPARRVPLRARSGPARSSRAARGRQPRAARPHGRARALASLEEPDSALALGRRGPGALARARRGPAGRGRDPAGAARGGGRLRPPRSRRSATASAGGSPAWLDSELGARLARPGGGDARRRLAAVRGLALRAVRRARHRARAREVASQLAGLTPGGSPRAGAPGHQPGPADRLRSRPAARRTPVRTRALLWAVHRAGGLGAAPRRRALGQRRRRACRPPFYLACGYVPAGPRALRADRAERFAAAARRRPPRGPAAGARRPGRDGRAARRRRWRRSWPRWASSATVGERDRARRDAAAAPRRRYRARGLTRAW